MYDDTLGLCVYTFVFHRPHQQPRPQYQTPRSLQDVRHTRRHHHATLPNQRTVVQRIEWAPFPPARCVASDSKTQIAFLFFVYYRSDSKSCHPIIALIETHHYSCVCDVSGSTMQDHREFPFQDCKIPAQSKNIPENSSY